jgi:hypothetical protein
LLTRSVGVSSAGLVAGIENSMHGNVCGSLRQRSDSRNAPAAHAPFLI